MDIKEKIKDILGEVIYQLYDKKIIKNSLHVLSMDQTIKELIDSEKSIVRFGDSDIVVMRGRTVFWQESAPELSDKLKSILHFDNEGLMVAIPDIFGNLDQYSPKSKMFWKKHLLSFRGTYLNYCDVGKIYANAFLSRMYYNYKDKSQCGRWIQEFKKVWENKELIFVEGAGTHNGVGNDLFDQAVSIERIVCPPQNAFYVYDKILEQCLNVPKNKLFMVSLGSTAKVLVNDLFEAGYRVIDIGNLDMEYEWFIHGASEKQPIEKHLVIGKDANLAAGYEEYWKQIIAVIELEKD